MTRQCRLTAHRRGGPGGQHRNKVSSAVMALHLPTGVSAEASERRDQSENRRVALERLRLRLAIVLRSAGEELAQRTEVETELRARWQGRPLKIGESNFDRSAVLALVLNDLHRAGGQPSLVAGQWQISTSSLVHFVASVPPAFQLLNRWREHHHRSPLKP
ncbi:MAG: peptide chain release factor family protein [Planctomycetaceae bacterium]